MADTQLTRTTHIVAGPSLTAIERYMAATFDSVPGECTWSIARAVFDTHGVRTLATVDVDRDAAHYDDLPDWNWSSTIHPA